jgi:hypothetical protein
MENGLSMSVWPIQIRGNAVRAMLCNAPETFQHYTNDIFREFLDNFVIINLDDLFKNSQGTQNTYAQSS